MSGGITFPKHPIFSKYQCSLSFQTVHKHLHFFLIEMYKFFTEMYKFYTEMYKFLNWNVHISY